MKYRFSILFLIFVIQISYNAKEHKTPELKSNSLQTVDNTELILNGSAIRQEAQHTVFVGGLYLKQQASSFEEIIADPNPKRFLLYCSTDQISSEKLINSWEQGFAINYSADEVAQLKPMIEEFNKVWKSGLMVGDEVWVDFIPDQGTKISLNGQLISQISGTSFYHAFLKTWLGPHPFNLKMKQALLGN